MSVASEEQKAAQGHAHMIAGAGDADVKAP